MTIEQRVAAANDKQVDKVYTMKDAYEELGRAFFKAIGETIQQGGPENIHFLLSMHKDKAMPLFEILESAGLLEQTEKRRFGLTPAGRGQL